jgi:hypothetical protein
MKVMVKWTKRCKCGEFHTHLSRMRWPGSTFKLRFRLKHERGIGAKLLATWPIGKGAAGC